MKYNKQTNTEYKRYFINKLRLFIVSFFSMLRKTCLFALPVALTGAAKAHFQKIKLTTGVCLPKTKEDMFKQTQKTFCLGSTVINKSSIYYHVKELKLRVGYLGFSFLITFFICYYYSFEILYLFVKPFLNYEKNFIFTDLTEAFYTTIQLNFIVSIYILIPFIIYNIWCFYIPSTFLEERKKYNFFFSTIIILLGMSLTFIYFVVLSELYKFLLHFEISTNFMSIQLEARIQSYVQLACKIFFFSSILFQMPSFFFMAFEYGLITSNFLIKNRSQILFLNLLLAAFLSPPDLLTQVTLAICLQIIFEVLLLTTFIYNKLK